MKRKVPARKKKPKAKPKKTAARAKTKTKTSQPAKTAFKKVAVKAAAPKAVGKKKKPAPKSVMGKGGSDALSAAKVSIGLVEPKGHVRILRPKSFALLPAERDYGFPSETPELPADFGKDKLVLMPQDPERLFCYWEITPATLETKASDRRSGEEYGEALRLNWPARSLFDSNFEIRPIDFASRRWYVRVPHPGLSYTVELGWLGNHGHFISILGSNESLAPEPWNNTADRLKDASGPLAYALRAAGPVGSSGHLQVEEAARFALTDWNFSSVSRSSPGGGGAAPSAGKTVSPGKVQSLRIEARLEPGSRLRVGGSELTANSAGKVYTTVAAPVGSLSVELRLPGGERHAYTYDVTAGSP